MAEPARINPLLLAALAVAGMLLPRQAGRVAVHADGGDPGNRSSAGRDPASAPPVQRAARSGPDDPQASHPRPEDARPGADAGSPGQIPAAGWWIVLKRAAAGFSSDRIMAEAAGITFYALLALFPAIASLISIYGLFTDPAQLAGQLDGMNGVIPDGGIQIIGQQVKALASSSHKALGFGLVVGLLTSLWSANAGMKALFDAMNVVYHEKEKRSFVRLTTVSLSFTFGMVVFVIVAVLAVVALPVVLQFVGLGSITKLLLDLARWPCLLVVITVALALIYRFGPSRHLARWQWVSWGAVTAAVAWIAASAGFSYYVSNFGSYNKTYGSLGAVIGFMTWIWISSIVVLMGAEVNAELEQQTSRDSTTGPDRAIGQRGAEKADTKP